MASNYALIAEPNVRLAQIFEQLVREARLEPALARDGADAQRLLRERGAPSLLIVNLVMPKLDGFALLAELRRSTPATLTPAVVVSSSMQLRTTASGLRDKLGISEVLASGMTPAALRSAIERTLGVNTRPAAAGSGVPGGTPPRLPTKSSDPGARADEPRASSLRAPQRTEPRAAESTALPSGAAPPPLRRPHTTTGALPRVVDASVPVPRTLDPARLARLASLGLSYDRAPDAALQALVEETARTLHVPIALVSLVLEKQQWFKAHVGLKGELLAKQGTPLDQSFCRHVVDDDSASPLIVPNAKQHPLFSQNLLVRRGDIGSYAGAPLLTADGFVLGTLCIIDKQPLAISSEQVDQLIGLARRVAGELELRTLKPAVTRPSEEPTSVSDGAVLAKHAEQLRAAPLPVQKVQLVERTPVARPTDYLEAVLSQLEPGVMLMDLDRKITFANRALCALFGLGDGELNGWTHRSLAHRLAASSETPEELLRQLELHPDGPFVLREELSLDTPDKRVLRYVARPIRLPHGIAQLGTFSDVTAEVALRTANQAPVMFVEDEWPRPGR